MRFLRDHLGECDKMKFKTKEELEKYYCREKLCIGSHRMISEIFTSFKERIDFYNKYKSEPEEFCHDYKGKEDINVLIYNMMASEWRDCLFDYCFGDIE